MLPAICLRFAWHCYPSGRLVFCQYNEHTIGWATANLLHHDSKHKTCVDLIDGRHLDDGLSDVMGDISIASILR